MNTVFPLDRITITTSDRNFQRAVEVQVKRNGSDWQTWATGTVFNFDTDRIHESRLAIDMPEIAAKEFRLYQTHDSPPLKSPSLGRPQRCSNTASYHVCRIDLMIAKENIDNIPLFRLEAPTPNTKFAGDRARRPFTERYKHILYGAVALAIIGLLALQYRVFKQIGNPS
jgi:hypothetical protein